MNPILSINPLTTTPIGGWPVTQLQEWAGEIQQQFYLEVGATASATDIHYWTNNFEQGGSISDIHTGLAHSSLAIAAIDALYPQILNRTADSAGVANFENVLQSGLYLSDLKQILSTSQEAINDITAIHLSALGTNPSAADLSWAEATLDSGGLQSAIRLNWATGSAEQAALGVIYQNVLGHAPSTAGLSFWENTIAAGFSQAVVEGEIASSPESQADIAGTFSQVLNRPANANDLTGWEAALGAGSTQTIERTTLVASTEAQNDIIAIYQSALSRTPGAADFSYADSMFIGGDNQAQLRSSLASSQEEAVDLASIYQGVLARPPSGSEVSTTEAAIAGGTSQAAERVALASGAEAAADISAMFTQVLNRPASPTVDQPAWQWWLGVPGNSQASMRTSLAYSGEAQQDINALYETVLGRSADPVGMQFGESYLNAGNTQLRYQAWLAQSAEEAGNITALYTNLLGRAPNADEQAGLVAAVSVPFTGTPQFTLTGVVSGAAQTFATAPATTQLVELAVYVTTNSGVTPGLIDPYGNTVTFANATQLAAYLFGAALETGAANPVLVATYSLTVAWLAQIDQPLLQAGEGELNAARAALASGNGALQQADEVIAQVDFDTATAPAAQRGAQAFVSAVSWAQAGVAALAAGNGILASANEYAARAQIGVAVTPAGQAVDPMLAVALRFAEGALIAAAQGNWNLVQLLNAAADVSLQEAAQPLGARTLETERVYQNSGGTTVDVTVDPNSADPYGTATYHSKDQTGGIAGLLEPILTALLDIAAVLSGNDWALAVAAAVNTGEAGQNFAQGNALAGVLDLGAAAGFGAQAVGAFANAAGVASTATGDALAGAKTVLGGAPLAAATLGTEILEGTAFVGGLSGIVNSAENGNGLGTVAATLETAAAVAAGLVTTGPEEVDTALLNAAIGLSIAGGVTAGVAAIEQGNVADGLLSGLGALISAIALVDQKTGGAVDAPAQAVSDLPPAPFQTAQNIPPMPFSSGITADAPNPLVGGHAYFIYPNGSSASGTIIGVPGDGGLIVSGLGPVASTSILSITPPGGAVVAQATVSGIASEIAALNFAAGALRIAGIAAVEFPLASYTLGTLSALLNIYAVHLLKQTVFVGTIPGTTLQYVEDTAGGILTLQQTVATGSLQPGDYVQLAIGADGTLTTADGEVAGQINADHGFTISPVFQAEFNAGTAEYIDDPNTVYSSRALGRALRAAGVNPPSDMENPVPHHMVPGGGPNQTGNRDPSPAQQALKACGISLDSAPNGVWTSSAYNGALNRAGYVTFVNESLGGVTNPSQCLQILSNINQEVQAGQAYFDATGQVIPAWQ